MEVLRYITGLFVTLCLIIYGYVGALSTVRVINLAYVFEGPWWVVIYALGLVAFMVFDLTRKRYFKVTNAQLVTVTIINLIILWMYYTSDKYVF